MWSAEEKLSICHQTCTPGVPVAQVARRYALNANLIHKWLRDPRFVFEVDAEAEEKPEGRVDGPGGVPSASPVFLPVELVAEAVTNVGGPALSDGVGSVPSPGGDIQIELAGGHRLRIEGSTIPRRDPGAAGDAPGGDRLADTAARVATAEDGMME